MDSTHQMILFLPVYLLHRLQTHNNYHCVSYNFSWITCQRCLHI